MGKIKLAGKVLYPQGEEPEWRKEAAKKDVAKKADEMDDLFGDDDDGDDVDAAKKVAA